MWISCSKKTINFYKIAIIFMLVLSVFIVVPESMMAEGVGQGTATLEQQNADQERAEQEDAEQQSTQRDCSSCNPGELCNPIQACSFTELITSLLRTLSVFSGIVLSAVVIYAAFLITTAGGDSVKVQKARGIIKWGIIGFALIISADVLLSVVAGLF